MLCNVIPGFKLCFPQRSTRGDRYAEESASPPERDPEEFSMQIERVNLDKLRRVMYGGNMMLPSIIGSQMALNYLEEKGMLGLSAGCVSAGGVSAGGAGLRGPRAEGEGEGEGEGSRGKGGEGKGGEGGTESPDSARSTDSNV
jgi:hypothetical protein